MSFFQKLHKLKNDNSKAYLYQKKSLNYEI